MRHDDVPRDILELAASSLLQYSQHVMDRLCRGEFTEEDIISCILCGHVRKRTRDEFGEATNRIKYTISGPCCSGYRLYVVGKIILTDDGRRFRIITAHGLDD